MLQSPVARTWIQPSSGLVVKCLRLNPSTCSWWYLSPVTTIYEEALFSVEYKGVEDLR